MSNLMNLRDRHFMDACREIIKNLDPTMEINMREVAQRAAMSPAPHYYCTFEYALRMIRVLRHGRLKLRNDRRLMMWKELNSKADGLMKRQGYTLIEALSHILASEPASQFFITPGTALRIEYRLKSRHAFTTLNNRYYDLLPIN